MYIKRVFYRGLALSEDGRPQIFIDEVKDLFFSETALHGKINPDGKPIVPNASRFMKLGGNDNDVYVFDFVAEAFSDFKKSIESAIRSGNMISSEKHFSDLKATSGWIDCNAGYGIYLNAFKNFLMKYFEKLPTSKKKNVDDFSVFSALFLEFYQFFSTSFPFTKGAFMLGSLVSNQSSGMMLTIADYDYSSDKEKIEDFYNSPNFPAYKKAAIGHGFLIDKNAPWRLIADIDNPVMQSYINDQNLKTSFNRKFFFTAYFGPADLDGIATLKDIMANFYSSVVGENRLDTSITINSRDCFEISTRRRPIKDKAQIFGSFSETQWAELYLKIKNLETKINYSDDEIRLMARNVSDLKKKLDSASYMGYINKRFTVIPLSEGSNNYKRIKSHILETGKVLDSPLSDEIKKLTRIKKKTLY